VRRANPLNFAKLKVCESQIRYSWVFGRVQRVNVKFLTKDAYSMLITKDSDARFRNKLELIVLKTSFRSNSSYFIMIRFINSRLMISVFAKMIDAPSGSPPFTIFLVFAIIDCIIVIRSEVEVERYETSLFVVLFSSFLLR
jgi:hypothetical protein